MTKPTVTTKGDFECVCGRKQSAHIGIKAAEKIGWTFTVHHDTCPFCSGNEHKLRAAFENEVEEPHGST